jgi:hypothetical protein
MLNTISGALKTEFANASAVADEPSSDKKRHIFSQLLFLY